MERPVIGLRKETKDLTERRAPLTPEHVGKLVHEHGVDVIVQPAENRVFPDEEYRAAGASLNPDLSAAPVILGLKEIPVEDLERGKAYAFFSHTIKGQPYNMSMLARLLELGTCVFDYELVRDDRGRRLVHFGRFAGYAGAIDSFWILGRKLAARGIRNPFEDLRQATAYEHMHEVWQALDAVGERIRREGLPEAIQPFVVVTTGGGNVSKGLHAILKRFPRRRLSPRDLPRLVGPHPDRILHVEVRTPFLYRRKDGGRFSTREFMEQPDLYESRFPEYLPRVGVLLNGVYWEPRYPRMVTREQLAALWRAEETPRLEVIGDVSCDIEGSVEVTVKATTSEEPCYVYEPATGEVRDGWEGDGPAILAVDRLPSELPRAASRHFGEAFLPFVPQLARADLTRGPGERGLPLAFENALLVHRGALVPRWAHLAAHLPG